MRAAHPAIAGLLRAVTGGWRCTVGLKGLAINPVKPHLLAVACNDAYVRLYDRRMLPPLPKRNFHRSRYHRDGACLRFSPLHATMESYVRMANGMLPEPLGLPEGVTCEPGLYTPFPVENPASRRRQHTYPTYVAWSDDGNQLIAPYHNDGVYMWKVNGSGVWNQGLSAEGMPRAKPTPPAAAPAEARAPPLGSNTGQQAPQAQPLPAEVKAIPAESLALVMSPETGQLRAVGNKHFTASRYTGTAVSLDCVPWKGITK